MNFLGNAFSLQMLDSFPAVPIIEKVSAGDIPYDAVSCIGHADTASVLSDMLGRNVTCNRQAITLKQGDTLFVAQVMGGRLPEGATTLPDGMQIKFLKIRVLYSNELCVNDGKVCENVTQCYVNCSYIA